jgi:hypothetical protein
MTLFYANQFVTTTLSKIGGLNISDTMGIVLSSVAGIDITKPGIALFSYSDPLDTTKCEWIPYTSINVSNELVGAVRGQEGFPAKTHSNGCAIAFPLSASHINNLNDAILAIPTSTTTFTNKRIEPRIVTAVSYTTDTGTSLDVSTCDVFQVTAQAGPLKFNNPGGTPVAGQKLIIRIKDNGTARALTYDTQFRAIGNSLPTTTVLGKTLYMEFIFNLTDTKWDLIDVNQENGIPWTSFTPNWTNVTIGNGTNVGRYCQIGKTINYFIYLTFGNTTAITGFLYCSFPVAAYTVSSFLINGDVVFFDQSTGVFNFGKHFADAEIGNLDASTTYLKKSGTTSTIPFTFTTSDAIYISGTYEAA